MASWIAAAAVQRDDLLGERSRTLSHPLEQRLVVIGGDLLGNFGREDAVDTRVLHGLGQCGGRTERDGG
jgi:hypothetical protein